MKSNNLMNQMQRQQQEQMRRQQMGAWAAEQEKKRKRRRREEALYQVGGINVAGGSQLDVQGDVVGHDKFNQLNGFYPRDEKSGFTLFIERVFAFVFGLFVAGLMFGGIGAAISSAVFSTAAIGVVIGVVAAVIFAFVSASSISRYRD